MKYIDMFCNFITKHMTLILGVASCMALFWPSRFSWSKSTWIAPLLMLIMLGMGLTMQLSDFKLVLTRPRDLLVGCVAQFTIMPLLAFGLGKVFNLDTALLVGVVLVGTCPGGTASNVVTYLANGDVALSVSMTSVNTLLAPVLTPLMTYLLLRANIKVDVYSLFISIMQIVILPLAIGFVLNKVFQRVAEFLRNILPSLSVLAITFIIIIVVSHNSDKVLATSGVVFIVVVLHNLLGMGCGFALGKLLKFPMSKLKALAVEVGMQNSALATSLAATTFPNLAMATIPGAVFSVWHNLSGAIFATLFRNKN